MITHLSLRSSITVCFCLLLVLAGCAPAGEEPMAPTATEPAAPEGVLRAREAVLAFLREGANECVPPAQAGWSVEVDAEPPAGYAVYHFHSGGCMMTITTPAASGDDLVYHVALGDGPTGFCWQAVVDERGRIVLTGGAAQTEPALGNPAAAYCEEHGHRFEVVTREAGEQCGVCVFDDGRMCNGWAYFHGTCTPENAVAGE